MKIWTVTDVTDGNIRTSVHGTEENALDGLRSFIAANSEWSEEKLEEMDLLTLEDLVQTVMPDTIATINEHDLGPDIGVLHSVSPRRTS